MSDLPPPPPPDEPDPDDPEERDPERLYCPETGCNFSTMSASGLARHQTLTHKAGGASKPSPSTRGGETPPPPTATAPREPEVPPRPPRSRSGGVLDRLRGRLRPGRSAADPSPGRPKPKPSRGKRVSTAEDFSSAWADLGRRLTYSNYYPVGRMLTYQAPGAGLILDRAVAGTMLDRLAIQPIWRNKDRMEDPFYLIAPPVVIGAMVNTRLRQQAAVEAGDNETAQKLERQVQFQAEFLQWMLRHMLIRLAPAIAEMEAKRAHEDELIREAFPNLAPDVDPVQALISQLFAPPGAPGPIVMQEDEGVGYADSGTNGSGGPSGRPASHSAHVDS